MGRPVMATGRSPELVKVTACAALLLPSSVGGKVGEAGDAVTRMAAPVPLRFTDGVPTTKLPKTVRVAVLLPRAVGVNATLIVQLAPAANDEPQLLV